MAARGVGGSGSGAAVFTPVRPARPAKAAEVLELHGDGEHCGALRRGRHLAASDSRVTSVASAIT
jgi:hypothetical protein